MVGGITLLVWVKANREKGEQADKNRKTVVSQFTLIQSGSCKLLPVINSLPTFSKHDDKNINC